MFDKILVANRGEIACRVMRTARRLGVATVAVYSQADKNAPHVRMADEAICVGPPPSAQSYLQAERIVAACRETGSEAVHPGYGFLSENAAFARSLAAADIRFIGPPPGAIEAMGDKITSKKLAREAGVNTVPGHADAVADVDEAVRIARNVGYPVMLKASAGGGGKGMRIAHDDGECADGFERASNEARASFGDERIFIEKFVVEPRHIEIQVLADAHGAIVHLGERECSIQRRHQKVIEEAPSPFLNEATREAMGAQAIALAKAVGYRSAGTVEFIVDTERNFYFLEMNTRLQVEHPITEMITGLDLVEQMLRIAAGEPLGFQQADVRLEGWAVEARIYAEDPERGFLPASGRLSRFRPPPDAAGGGEVGGARPQSGAVRLDSGVVEGGEVSVHYDPMIAKLVAFGSDRQTAARVMADALDRTRIDGLMHNIAFLTDLVRHPRFLEGRLSTAFIDDEYVDGFDAGVLDEAEHRLFTALAVCVHCRYRGRALEQSGQLASASPRLRRDWVVMQAHAPGAGVEVKWSREQGVDRVEADGVSFELVVDWPIGHPLLLATVDGVQHCVRVARHGIGYRLSGAGRRTDLLVLSPRAAQLQALMPVKQAPDMSKFLLSPMPGLLVDLSVAPGDEVKAGQALAVVEAMKMENVLRADRDRVVEAVLAVQGDSLAVDQPIIEFV
ncbi:MAG: acetyl-CoA carboxylase biotin carboxylase subunit [Gammaproteobacteria bacterium]